MEMPKNMKLLSREEHEAQHKGILTFKVAWKDIKNNRLAIDAALMESHQVIKACEFRKIKKYREVDKKILDIKWQLRLVRDKCPAVWEILTTNYCPIDFDLEWQYEGERCNTAEANIACTEDCWEDAIKEGTE